MIRYYTDKANESWGLSQHAWGQIANKGQSWGLNPGGPASELAFLLHYFIATTPWQAWQWVILNHAQEDWNHKILCISCRVKNSSTRLTVRFRKLCAQTTRVRNRFSSLQVWQRGDRKHGKNAWSLLELPQLERKSGDHFLFGDKSDKGSSAERFQ